MDPEACLLRRYDNRKEIAQVAVFAGVGTSSAENDRKPFPLYSGRRTVRNSVTDSPTHAYLSYALFNSRRPDVGTRVFPIFEDAKLI